MQHKFYVKEVPDPYPIWEWINKHTNVNKIAESLKPSIDTAQLITLNHTFDVDALRDATLEAIDKFHFHGWLSAQGRFNHYGGLSITYNPDYTEKVDDNSQTLGTEKNFADQYFYDSIQNFKNYRNTYFDAYGYRQYAPCVTQTKLKNIVSSFSRSLIRSRIGVVNAEYTDEILISNGGWHRDEPIHKNLRINIPILTDETFFWEMENVDPVHLPYGNIYSWDTNIAHRVFPTVKEKKLRVHVVFGFSPWFDYIPEEDAFVSNEFFGEMHPFDMLINGHVHPDIVGIR